MIFLLLSLAFSIALCVHVVRTGREFFWLWIILFVPTLGGLVYLAAVVLPELGRGPQARRITQNAREVLDPTREYRAAKEAHDDSPTVRASMRLASAAAGIGRHDEAEELYRQAARGVHDDDPDLLLGRAGALVELGRFSEALELLDRLGQDEGKGRTPGAALALGRTYEGLGRNDEADTAYQWAANRLPGLEGIARYTAFMARTGRKEEAQEALDEIDRRLKKTNAYFKKEGRAWRDLAAEALASS